MDADSGSTPGICGNICGLLCPCCCHPKHRFCTPCKFTLVGCVACWCWLIVLLPILWALLTFAVIQPVLCSRMHTELYPEETWVAHLAEKNPSNWEFGGTQLQCTQAMNSIKVEDWRVDSTEWREVFFKSTDGLKLQGFFLIGQNGEATGIGPAQQAPTIIQGHGHGGSASGQSQMLPAKGLQQQGFNVLLFNSQGLGKSQAPDSKYAIRTFGADELTNTEGAIKLVTEDPDGVLPFVTPLHKVGIFSESGSNGMVLFIRKNIPGIVMQSSIYDWYAQFQKVAGEVGVGWLPLVDTLLMNCASAKAQRGGIVEENYKDQLNRAVYNPTGRKVLRIHNIADEYNRYDDHARGWETDLKAKGFDVTTYNPDEDGEEDCNSHLTILFDLKRKAHFQKMCSFWEMVFNVSASCGSMLAFDTMLPRDSPR